MCFVVFVFSSFLHEEAALFYICFDVTIVVNTKYMLKLNHTTRDNKARYLVSLNESLNTLPCFRITHFLPSCEMHRTRSPFSYWVLGPRCGGCHDAVKIKHRLLSRNKNVISMKN